MNYFCRSESAQYYECGYSCDNGIFLRMGSEFCFITDGRYVQEARDAISQRHVIEGRNIFLCAKDVIEQKKLRTLIIDPFELNLAQYQILQSIKGLELIQRPHFSQEKRAIKTEHEISLLSTAAKIGARAFGKIARSLEQGKSEQELQFIARSILEGFGKRALSFDPILSFNKTSANPHAKPTTKLLKNGDLVLLDAGIKYERYVSDRTRVLEFARSKGFAKKQYFSNKKRQKIYDLVLKAKEVATNGAKVGMRAKDLDALARNIIEKAGYGKYFVHSLGHGIGLDIHEFPFISSANDDILLENMVFTIEPGIYLPDEFGVRIEDSVLLTSKGAKEL